MTAAQVLRQAEELKTAVQDTSRGANEAWVSRQNLQDLYQKILVLDLEYALDKKVEQDLWNHAFKNQINTLQTQAKDKQHPKRPEIVSSLNLFLETASGFYLQLLEELCSAFKLDLQCRRKSSTIGILKDYGPVASKIKAPRRSSCLYICQHCLVHLGDIARYREEIEQAQTYYRHAANIVPYNGQPYNQLAILEAAKGNKLATVVYYIHSIAVKHPFPVACTNLEKFYTKITKEIPDYGRKLSMNEMSMAFLQLNALIHLAVRLDVAKSLSTKILSSFPSHITSMSFSTGQLVHIITVLIFTLYYAQCKQTPDELDDSIIVEPEGKNIEVTLEQQKGYDIGFSFTANILDLFLGLTPKQESKAKEYHTLAAVKVLCDWLRTDSELIHKVHLQNPNICQNLSKLLNNLQFSSSQKDVPSDLEKYVSVPLPEDCDLQCFLPLQNIHSDLDFHLMPIEGLSQELEMRLRCQRLIEHGLWLCDKFPSLNLVNVQKQKSGRLYFSAPSSHVKALAGIDPEGTTEKKPYRQNVAIQAIMQNKSKKDLVLPNVDLEQKEGSSSNSTIRKSTTHSCTTNSDTVTNSTGNNDASHGNDGRCSNQGKGNKKYLHDEKFFHNSDAGIMVNTATETQEPQEKPIPSDAWDPQKLSKSVQNPSQFRGPTLSWSADVSNQMVKSTISQDVPSSVPGDLWSSKTHIPSVNFKQPLPGLDDIKIDESMNQNNCPDYLATIIQGSPVATSDKTNDRGNLNNPDSVHSWEAGNLPQDYRGPLQTTGMQNNRFGGLSIESSCKKEKDKNPLPNHEQQQLFMKLQQIPKNEQVKKRQQELDMQKVQESLMSQQPWQLQQQQYPLQQQQTDSQCHEHVHYIDKEIMLNAEKIKQLSQQQTRSVQYDQELHVLQQQLQQLQVQQKQSTDPRHQQQLQQIIAHHEHKLRQKYQLCQEMHKNQEMSQQLLQVQQQKLLQERKKFDSFIKKNPPVQSSKSGENTQHSDPTVQWPSTYIEMPKDQSQVLAVMEMKNQNLMGQQWGSVVSTEHHYPFGISEGQNTLHGQNEPLGPETNRKMLPLSPVPSEDAHSGVNKSHKSISTTAFSMPATTEDSKDKALSMAFLQTYLQGMPKPDSLPSSVGHKLSPDDSVPSSNTYSLFSQSPWTVQLTSADTKSHTSTPFGSSSSSVRTTPDPHQSQEEHFATSKVLGSGLGLGYTLPQSTSPSESHWNVTSDKSSAEATATSQSQILHGNIQSIWSTGPSPLQRLLEQQKNQRHGEPH